MYPACIAKWQLALLSMIQSSTCVKCLDMHVLHVELLKLITCLEVWVNYINTDLVNLKMFTLWKMNTKAIAHLQRAYQKETDAKTEKT